MFIYFFSGFFAPLPWILVIYLATETLVKMNDDRCPVTSAQEKVLWHQANIYFVCVINLLQYTCGKHNKYIGDKYGMGRLDKSR